MFASLGIEKMFSQPATWMSLCYFSVHQVSQLIRNLLFLSRVWLTIAKDNYKNPLLHQVLERIANANDATEDLASLQPQIPASLKERWQTGGTLVMDKSESLSYSGTSQ